MSLDSPSTPLTFADSLAATTPVWYRLEAVSAIGEYLLITNPIFAGPLVEPTLCHYGDFV
jgi:hypothetical protein